MAGALLIIVLANTISFVTGLSISAIATDMRVKAGGAYFVIRIQYVILAVLGLAMISLFSGTGAAWTAPAQAGSTDPLYSFWEVFAVVFPAVTGIMVGVSMSGDLKHPGRDIPRGTLSAIGVTALIYAAVAIWLFMHADPQALRADALIMLKISRWPQLIIMGVWASTLSSALGSAMAAPRTLQALAFDQIVPRFAGRQLGSTTEPRVAVLITTALALIVIFLGQLNFIAKLIFSDGHAKRRCRNVSCI